MSRDREHLYLQVAERGTPEALAVSGSVALRLALVFRPDVDRFSDGRRQQSGGAAEINVARCRGNGTIKIDRTVNCTRLDC